MEEMWHFQCHALRSKLFSEVKELVTVED